MARNCAFSDEEVRAFAKNVWERTGKQPSLTLCKFHGLDIHGDRFYALLTDEWRTANGIPILYRGSRASRSGKPIKPKKDSQRRVKSDFTKPACVAAGLGEAPKSVPPPTPLDLPPTNPVERALWDRRQDVKRYIAEFRAKGL